ncbi:hypothetical protein DFH08DRAFT_1071546 [Mycena albidolilacea]|uniref:Uncharacterized protein n=1 Tax=Mycena albidolilacea TaxID=1033008 RepID=A0AAD7F7Q4_9AGAR|nr:hypothetical protein DFH08DRAFT_1071546 [Mycena albidolilacea]
MSTSTPSYLLAVPPEIWALIAPWPAVGQLLASPLSPMNSTRDLVKTLCEPPSALKFNPHPRQLIQYLCLPGSRYRPADCFDALRNLVEMSPSTGQFSGELVRGAALRALEWKVPTTTDELVDLLCTPGYFPDLKDLSVEYGLDARVDCFRVLDLEKLECKLNFSGAGYEEWQPSWAKTRTGVSALVITPPPTAELTSRTLSIGNRHSRFYSPLSPHAFADVISLDAHADGDTSLYPQTFYPDSLSCLVAAFPNLTRLDAYNIYAYAYCNPSTVQIPPGLCDASGSSIPVRVQVHPGYEDYERRATEQCPPENFAAEIDDGLRLLPVLSSVHIVLWATDSLART